MRLPMYVAPRLPSTIKAEREAVADRRGERTLGSAGCMVRGRCAPGNRNAWKHDGYSYKAVSLRQHLAELTRIARRLVETF